MSYIFLHHVLIHRHDNDAYDNDGEQATRIRSLLCFLDHTRGLQHDIFAGW